VGDVFCGNLPIQSNNCDIKISFLSSAACSVKSKTCATLNPSEVTLDHLQLGKTSVCCCEGFGGKTARFKANCKLKSCH
jgi:hypothetical protein